MGRSSAGQAGRGVRIRDAHAAGAGYRAGLRGGDRIVSVDGMTVHHELDFAFLSASADCTVNVIRRGTPRRCRLRCAGGLEPQLDLVQSPLGRCRNRCLFCFIEQMPPGLRRSLYIKDEDIRHSFLNGNFVTLTAMSPAELDLLTRMRLSPLYVSVHATDCAVRNRLLGNAAAPSIMAQLRALRRRAIAFHTQIVVCPGINDGPVLERTVRDLLALRPATLSIGIVPVGLTRFHRRGIRPLDSAQCRAVCALAARLGGRARNAAGRRMVFCADELFLSAGLPLPPQSYYAEYPQYQNGIGILRATLAECTALLKGRALRGGRVSQSRWRVLILTGMLAAPALGRILAAMQSRGAAANASVVAVRNTFFGETVTVAGLLSARDILRAGRSCALRKNDTVLLPAVMFNHRGYTLDGYSAARIAKRLGARVTIADMKSLAAALGLRSVGRGA